MITANDLDIPDKALAARIMAQARAIAPCISSLTGDAKDEAIALLQAIARDAASGGARGVASRQVGTARLSYRDVTSWFTDDDRAALRALCAAPGSGTGHPVGAFPAPARAYKAIWPEEGAP